MMYMFRDCQSLISLDLSSFDTSKVKEIHSIFHGCTNLQLIDFRNATFNSVRLYDNMFTNTSNLSVIVKNESARSWMQNKLGSNGTAIIAS